MSNRTKMYIANSKARKYLHDNGYTDIHLFPHNTWSKDIHFRGLSFDGLATIDNQLALFQIKTNCACTKKVQQQMQTISDDTGLVLLWINNIKRKGLQVVTTFKDNITNERFINSTHIKMS